jgi:hypothetical protein
MWGALAGLKAAAVLQRRRLGERVEMSQVKPLGM